MRRIVLDSNRKIDENGFWYIPLNPISSVGVYDYLPNEVGCEALQGEQFVKVFKSPDGYPDSLIESLKHKPILINHDWLGDEGTKDITDLEAIGHVGENVTFDGTTLYADIYIQSKKAQAMIDAGFKELSLGSETTILPNEGQYNGERYNAVMLHDRANHIALVREGRCGTKCSILDHRHGVSMESKKSPLQRLLKALKIVDSDNTEKVRDTDEPTRDTGEIIGDLKENLPLEYHAPVAEAIEELAGSLAEAERAESERGEENKTQGEEGGEVTVEMDEKEVQDTEREEKDKSDVIGILNKVLKGEQVEDDEKEEVRKNFEIEHLIEAIEGHNKDADTTEDEASEESEEAKTEDSDEDEEKSIEEKVQDAIATNQYLRNSLGAIIGNIPAHYTSKQILDSASKKLGIAPTMDAVKAYCLGRASVKQLVTTKVGGRRAGRADYREMRIRYFPVGAGIRNGQHQGQQDGNIG